MLQEAIVDADTDSDIDGLAVTLSVTPVLSLAVGEADIDLDSDSATQCVRETLGVMITVASGDILLDCDGDSENGIDELMVVLGLEDVDVDFVGEFEAE